MASFDEHIQQANNNLKFLTETNSKCQSFWDWQVTTCFYTAVHLVNAHLAKVANLHYRTHEHVKNAINPFNPLAVPKVSQDLYLSYTKLEGLSRRSRYLCHEDLTSSNAGHLTYDKHLAKAIRHLDIVLDYFTVLYNLTFSQAKIFCPDLSKNDKLKMFQI